MTVRLVENRYGKSHVRLVAVVRGSDRHELSDLTVDIRFTGDYETAYREGDNSAVYATDSMKNSVYAMAREHGSEEVDLFAARLAKHFLAREAAPAAVEIRIAERPWQRIEVGGKPHRHAFVAAGSERRIACVEATAADQRFSAGIEDLLVLKTTGSAFAGFPRDRYTTLADTDDRILSTMIAAAWRYNPKPASFDAAFARARREILETFADQQSLSVQHTVYAMGARVLAAVQEIEEITLRLPNKHHLRVDLAPFGLDNPNLVFVATSEPFGLIEGTLKRGV